MADVVLYKSKDDAVTEMLAQLIGMVPDAYVGDDGIIKIIFEIEAGQLENAFLANQLVLNDMFIQTASLQGLIQHGLQIGLPMKGGTYATGTVTFEGAGGTYIPLNSEVGYDPGAGVELVYFQTTLDGTIPDPGIPAAPVAAVGAAGGLTGSYEYRVTFVTATGETLASVDSNAISVSAQQVNLTGIPVGGVGTTRRRIYRDKNGANNYRLVTEIANNTATTYTDNVTDATVNANSAMPTVDTAHRITLNAAAEETGILGNVIANTITELADAPAALTGIVASSAFTGGADPEDIENYRQRLLDFVRNPQTGSPTDIEAWAESVDGVGSATVFSNDNMGTPTNGHVTVRIAAPDGSAPSTTIQNNVLAYLNSQDLANVTFHVTTFTAVPLNVTVDVTAAGTYTLADLTPATQQAIMDYINEQPVGGTIYISGIITAVKILNGVLDVTVTTPTTNQTATATQKFTPGTITVT
jgi:uncharacterized phage protein gp47/JayE